MKISFHMGSPHFGEVNTMTFWEIKDREQLETIKLITKNSELLLNAFEEDSYVAHGPEENHTIYNLTIYLPHYDKSFIRYGNFEYLFKHDKYLNWKKMITDEFPELLEQFTIAEKEAKTRQELYQTGRYSFHRNEERVKLLQQLVTELHQELCPPGEFNFDF